MDIGEAEIIDGEAKTLRQHMYTLLAQLLEGESEEIVWNCENHELRGFEAWRRLVKRWDPMSIGRKRNILSR
eukprot:10554810-Prorocentrum_lima.AAC.1